jgi:hypothetical protein
VLANLARQVCCDQIPLEVLLWWDAAGISGSWNDIQGSVDIPSVHQTQVAVTAFPFPRDIDFNERMRVVPGGEAFNPTTIAVARLTPTLLGRKLTPETRPNPAREQGTDGDDTGHAGSQDEAGLARRRLKNIGRILALRVTVPHGWPDVVVAVIGDQDASICERE